MLSHSEQESFNIDCLLAKLTQCLEAQPDKVDLRSYVEAYDELYKLFMALGTLFGFVASDVRDKCDILKKYLTEVEHYSSVEGMIEYEMAEDLITADATNGCRTLLRLHRAMPFVARFLERVHAAGENDALKKHGKEAYDQTLAQYHPWLIRKAVGLAVYSLPTRKNLLNIIAGETSERHEYVAGVAPTVVSRLDAVFEKVQVLYSEKSLLDLPWNPFTFVSDQRMTMDGDNDSPPISDQEKVRIASDFIQHAPPGEFNEVFNDVRILINNDALLKEGVSASIAQYNKEQLIPVKVQDAEIPSLISDYNDIGGGRFYDPRSKLSFKVDHLRKEAMDFQGWSADSKVESWRAALEEEMTSYVGDHYRGMVSGGAFGPSALIMDQDVAKKLKFVAYCACMCIIMKTDEIQSAQELTRIICDAENKYQSAIVENYHTMSDTTFKALRRQLPVTRTKIDWNKILSYSIGKELNRQ
ncbi:unnamed protein product [Notodromas monacha]|uniref:F-actin-capping protein subunit alpha n=1 Tax=Notodromas monacha TaxID=399045 RepID=A0A7R9GD51_9CRUS|nr:unnamed protein product [Notodromas monacha]CAG0918174.1 unnamed protein product [Notodromas monacha]